MAEQLKTGIEELDEVLSGKGKKELYIFAAETRPRSLLVQLLKRGEVEFNFEMDDPPDKKNMP